MGFMEFVVNISQRRKNPAARDMDDATIIILFKNFTKISLFAYANFYFNF